MAIGFGRQETYVGLSAVADLSAKQYHIVRLSGLNQVNQASLGTDSAIAGVLQTKPTSGQAAVVAYAGETKLVAGGTITANDILTSDSSGRAVTVASGQIAVARARTAGAAGDEMSAWLFPPVRWAGAA